MKKLFYLFLSTLSLFALEVRSQQSTNATGGNATGSGGSSSFTIGQTDYNYSESSSGSVSEGVQQIYSITVVSNPDPTDTTGNNVKDINLILKLTVYPNPSVNNLTLEIDKHISGLKYALYNIEGKVLLNDVIKENKTIISTHLLPTSVYYLKINDGDFTLKTFKIIKSHN